MVKTSSSSSSHTPSGAMTSSHILSIVERNPVSRIDLALKSVILISIVTGN